MAVEVQTGTVEENRRWTEHLYSIKMHGAFGDFEPGQFARIGLHIVDENILRPYSFVNAKHEPLYEFYYTVVPEGPLSTRLPELKKGDSVLFVPKPNGYMVLSEIQDAAQLWMLSTGTAVGPFISILKSSEVWQRFDKLVLVHAVRTIEELSYGEEIRELVMQSRGRLQFVPFVSREDADFALRGRIPAAIESGILQEKTELQISPTDSQVMICGNPQMVKDTFAVLESLGLERNRRRKPGHVTMENYW